MAYGQYRFWRIRFITTQGAVTPRIARIRFYGNSGAADDWTIPTIGVSDTGKADANSNNAADASTATNWITGQSAVTDAWVGARIYGGPAQIKEIGITATNDVNFAGAPSAFWVEGSNDDDTVAIPANWVRLAYVGAATWTQGSTQTFAYTVVSPTDTAKISRVAADVSYSAARTAKLSAVETEVLQKPSGVNTRLSAVPTQVLTTNINSPSTTAALLTATTSIISGAAHINGIATSSTTDSITYSGDPVTYNGDPVIIGMAGTATTSLIPGVGSPGVPGVTPSSIVVSTTYSLLPGTASVVTFVDATANGDLVTTTESLIAGHAAIDASTPARVLTVGISELAGNGSGTANASGALITDSIVLIPGGETGTASVGGHLFTDTISLIPGTATGQRNALVPAQTLTIGHVLIDGLEFVSSEAAGQLVTVAVTLVEGRAAVNSTARGNVIPFPTSLVAGTPRVDVERSGVVLPFTAAFPDNRQGGATGDAEVSGDLTTFTHQVLVEGSATGTATAEGQLIAAIASLLKGVVSADAFLDPQVLLTVDIAFDPGVGSWFLGTPGDDMDVPDDEDVIRLLPENRIMKVTVEIRRIMVPREDRVLKAGPRVKGIVR